MNEQSSFDAFCQREFPRLVGSITLYCGDSQVAEEIAQEALIRAYRDWRRVQRLGAPGAWTHKVGLNLAHSHYRRKAAERRARNRLRDAAPPAQVEPNDVLALRQAITQLPHRQKTALLLRYYADLPIPEVADQMGCSASTAKTLIRRALDAFRTNDLITMREVGNVS